MPASPSFFQTGRPRRTNWLPAIADWNVLFPDEGHGFRKIPNRIRSTVEVTRWFAKYLEEPEQTANK
jgi:hypothetical protein